MALSLFRFGNVVDRERDLRIVVEDRPCPPGVAEGSAHRIRKVERVRLVQLVQRLSDDSDGNLLRELAGCKGERARRRGVVAGGFRRPVRSRVIDGYGAGRRRRERDREERVLGARVALGHQRVTDRERRGVGRCRSCSQHEEESRCGESELRPLTITL
jgi:hypothetical protein